MYRLKVQNNQGEYIGYHWRSLDESEFAQIITGAQPLVYNADPTFHDDTAVYAAVWDPLLNDWISNVSPVLVNAYYRSLDFERPGA